MLAGTFFLTLTAALAPGGPGGSAPLAIGACLTSLVYGLDHVSSEFNPGALHGDRNVVVAWACLPFSPRLI